ncbi:MAG TPA: hypothetical protein VG389_19850 [Myxococcota bacterium]|jgi:hypothetical protein|nr:hypothetical protein [Myxococcota bacterium]
MKLRARFLGVLLGAAALLVVPATAWAHTHPTPAVSLASVALVGHLHSAYCGHYRVYYHGGWYYWVDGSWDLWNPVAHVWVVLPAYRAPLYVRHFEARAKVYHPGRYKAWHGGPAHKYVSPRHGKGMAPGHPSYSAKKAGPRFKGGKGR